MRDKPAPIAENEDDKPSKSARKREMQERQALGEKLTRLSDTALGKIPLTPALTEGIAIARRIKSREALRRQYQYIGKLMRETDIEPISQALEELESGQQAMARRFHQLEHWRDRLIEEGQTAIEAFLQEAPNAERQKLRQLVMQAQKERDAQKPPASSRKLFRYLRELEKG